MNAVNVANDDVCEFCTNDDVCEFNVNAVESNPSNRLELDAYEAVPVKLVAVTDVNPVNEEPVAPKAILVDPIIILLVANWEGVIFPKVPPNVIVPEVVIVPPVKVIPFTFPDVPTDVTVPPPDVAIRFVPTPADAAVMSI